MAELCHIRPSAVTPRSHLAFSGRDLTSVYQQSASRSFPLHVAAICASLFNASIPLHLYVVMLLIASTDIVVYANWRLSIVVMVFVIVLTKESRSQFLQPSLAHAVVCCKGR